MKQEIDEPTIKYLHWLRTASRYSEFENLGQEEQTIGEDLIQLRLIEGMYNAYWTSPGDNTPLDTNYTATCLPSRKLYKLDEPDTQDTAGEARTSS